MKKKVLNRFSALILALICMPCGLAVSAPASATVSYAATSPWTASIVDFIGGTSVKVRSIGNWGASGNIRSTSRPRADEIIIALDSAEAAELRINKNNPKLRLLYDNLALPPGQKYSVFFDPAMMPFIAQGIMKTLAEADSQRYSFYQRRLAEFQSRIDSTVEIGRYMLEGVRLLDLTGAQGAWLRAAMPGAVRPPDGVWNSWLAGDTASMDEALAEADRRGWLILLDIWTPPVIRNAADRYAKKLTVSPPALNQDIFTFLHDIFITVAQKSR